MNEIITKLDEIEKEGRVNSDGGSCRKERC